MSRQALPDTQVKRDDVRTWGCPKLGCGQQVNEMPHAYKMVVFCKHNETAAPRKDWLPSPSNGILHGFGFGQSDFMWHLRMLPGVKDRYRSFC